MVDGVIRGMLGPSLTPIYDYILVHPQIISVILMIWIILYVLGRYQLTTIERKTKEMVLDLGRKEIARNPHISSSALYKKIYPEWEAELKGKKWGTYFILHRLEFWPVPVKPETVLVKFPFSAEWIEDLLVENQIRREEHNPAS
jgi:hypothetical protein